MAIEFLSLDLGCGDFILTNSIAFFYSFGLTSIVTLQTIFLKSIFQLDFINYKYYNNLLQKYTYGKNKYG